MRLSQVTLDQRECFKRLVKCSRNLSAPAALVLPSRKRLGQWQSETHRCRRIMSFAMREDEYKSRQTPKGGQKGRKKSCVFAVMPWFRFVVYKCIHPSHRCSAHAVVACSWPSFFQVDIGVMLDTQFSRYTYCLLPSGEFWNKVYRWVHNWRISFLDHTHNSMSMPT